eukprot:UN26134
MKAIDENLSSRNVTDLFVHILSCDTRKVKYTTKLIIFFIIAYSFCSSSLLLLNKVVLHFFLILLTWVRYNFICCM